MYMRTSEPPSSVITAYWWFLMLFKMAKVCQAISSTPEPKQNVLFKIFSREGVSSAFVDHKNARFSAKPLNDWSKELDLHICTLFPIIPDLNLLAFSKVLFVLLIFLYLFYLIFLLITSCCNAVIPSIVLRVKSITVIQASVFTSWFVVYSFL